MGTTGADRAARSAADSVDGVGVVSTGLRGGDRVGPSRERGGKKSKGSCMAIHIVSNGRSH